MRRLHTLCMVAMLLGSLAACGAGCPDQERDVDTATRAETKTYTLDENIGEMLLLGFRGTNIDSTNSIVRDLTELHVGSVILFDYDAPSSTRGRNITDSAQVARLCAQLKRLSPTLLIGIDQEGGSVSRLASRHGFGKVASHKQTAAGGADSVRAAARRTAQMLHAVGINLDFAPVADVDVNPSCPVIGALGRSFSADEDRVAEYCGIWIEELAREGVASCMKHFPGHGSARGDTHRGLVDVTDTWQRRELTPYRQLAQKAPMVMTAHVVNRKLEPEGLPASLSAGITALLRDTLGFEGVVVTDDLAMGAISGHYSLQQTIERAIDAGADLLCLSNNGSHFDPQLAAKAVASIKLLVETGKTDAERIHTSAQRIRALKARLALEQCQQTD